MRKSILGGCAPVASLARCVVTLDRRHRELAAQLHVLRRRLVDFAAVLIAFIVATAAATAGTSGPVRAWYYDQYGNMLEACGAAPYGSPCGWIPGTSDGGAVPSDLGRCKRVAVGGGHFAAITTSNQLRMWGNNDRGQTNVPWYLDSVSRVALGESHTVVVDVDGFVIGWGSNDYGQISFPYNLGLCRDVAAGSNHTLLIKTNGSVRAFGANDRGQCNVPANLGSCSQVAAGAFHSVALRTDGVVRAWGGTDPWCPTCNDCGQTNANGTTGVTAISASYRSTTVLQGSTSVSSWGCKNCEYLWWDQAGYRSISSTYAHVVGVTTDGRLRGSGPTGWAGCQDMGNDRFPTNIGRVVSVSGYSLGGTTNSLFIAIQDDDCDDNGYADADDILAGRGLDLNQNNRLDTCEIADGSEKDCNLDGRIDSYQVQHGEVLDNNFNGVPDSCDIANGYEEDCDHNGVIDSAQQQLNIPFGVSSQQVGPIGYNSPRTLDLAAPPYTLTDVNLLVSAFGDFSSPSEYLRIYLNGRWVAEVLAWSWKPGDCQGPAQGQVSIPRDFFNEVIKAGPTTSATFEVVPSIAVNANQCPTGSWVQVSLNYTAAITGDCNANGLLDTCEITLVPEADGNFNGIIDACENYSLVFQCAGDLDGGGSVDTADLSIMLMSFGSAMPGDPADLDADGAVNTADISLLLLSFGDC